MKQHKDRLLKIAFATVTGVLAMTMTLAAQESENDGNKLPLPKISSEFPFESRYVQVLGSNIHYVESGSGDPIIFIHGNPTSSYLWRNVIPFAATQGRAIAIDMIGMGKSDKPDIEYRFIDHLRYIEGFIDAMHLRNITFVVHDWGAALGFEYARRNPDNVRGIAFMEGVLPPSFPQPSFEAMGPEMGEMFRTFKDPRKGVEVVITNNMFVEQILPGFVNRTLSEAEMNVYRAPYLQTSARKPLLAWPREIPIAGEPADVAEVLTRIEQFMGRTEIPMLLLYASPGVVIPPQAVPWYVNKIKNLETHFVGQGFHYLQEDQPEAIGRAIADWMRRN